MRDAVREAVERGCELLDEEHPGWELRLDLGKLDLGDACTCVLGQLEGDFYAATQKRFGSCDDEDEADRWADEHGFAANESGTEGRTLVRYELLTEAWRDAVKERLDRGVSITD